MRQIKEAFITYLAIWGFILIAPFFLVLVSIPALAVWAILGRMGVSEDISTAAAFITVFVSIFVFSQVYAVVRFRKMERGAEQQDRE